MKRNLAWLCACLMLGTIAGCDDTSSESQTNCTGNEVKCADGTHIRKCDNGQWGNAEACPLAAPTCDENLNKCVECSGSDTKCENDSQIKVCSNGLWGAPTTCPQATPVCDNNRNECVEGDLHENCNDGEKRCDGTNKIQTCSGNTWGASEPCPNTEPVCNTSLNRCEAESTNCTGTETMCADGTHVKTCDGGTWGLAVECTGATPVCGGADQKCVTCIAGSKECVDGQDDQYKECSADNTWGNPTTCPTATPVCNSEQHDCVAGTPNTTCQDDQKRCDGDDKYQVCSSNSWGAAQTCPATSPKCDPTKGECVECIYNSEASLNQIQCFDSSNIQTCDDDGHWNTPSPCETDKPVCDESLKKCVECTPNADVCEIGVGGKTGELYHCSAQGIKEHVKSCPLGCNSTFTDCTCKNGERRCSESNIEICNNGVWKSREACSKSQICNESIGSVCIPAIGSVCTTNDAPETICNGDVLMECVNGLYEEASNECNDGSQCLQQYCLTTNITKGERSARYSKECKNNSYCIGDVKYVCDSNGPDAGTNCGTELSNRSGYCVMVESSSSQISGSSEATCMISNKNFTFTCEGEDGNLLVFYLNDNERTEIVNCKTYGLQCQGGEPGVGGCVSNTETGSDINHDEI